jgi:hypothetical protein
MNVLSRGGFDQLQVCQGGAAMYLPRGQTSSQTGEEFQNVGL